MNNEHTANRALTRLDMIAALDAKQQTVYREAREAGFSIDYSITLARKSGDSALSTGTRAGPPANLHNLPRTLPGHEKPSHWFDTNTNGFSEET